MVSAVKDYAILMLDPQGRIVSWNAGAKRIKGYREQEIIGQHFSQSDLWGAVDTIEFWQAESEGNQEIHVSYLHCTLDGLANRCIGILRSIS